MNRAKYVLVSCVLAGLTMGLTIVSHADFIDHFSNGSVADSDTIHHFWNKAAYSGEKTSVITEQVGGHLKLSYFGPPNVLGGPRLFSGRRSVLDLFSHPVSVILTASPNGTLTPIKAAAKENGGYPYADSAWTCLGLTPQPGPALIGGPNRIVLQLSNKNALKFSIIDSTNAIVYTIGVHSLPIDARVQVMTFYIDGRGETKDDLFI